MEWGELRGSFLHFWPCIRADASLGPLNSIPFIKLKTAFDPKKLQNIGVFTGSGVQSLRSFNGY